MRAARARAHARTDAQPHRLKHFHSTLLGLMESHDLSTGPLWLGGQPSDAHYVAETRTTLWAKGWHKWQRSDMAGTQAIADVIVVNYALHYGGNLSEYEEHMPQMMAQLSEWVSAAPGRTALFRETGADHANLNPDLPEAKFQPDELGHPPEEVVQNCRCMQRPPQEEAGQVAIKANTYIKSLLKRRARRGAARHAWAECAPAHSRCPAATPRLVLSRSTTSRSRATTCTRRDTAPSTCCATRSATLPETSGRPTAATVPTTATRPSCGRRSLRAWRLRWQ